MSKLYSLEGAAALLQEDPHVAAQVGARAPPRTSPRLQRKSTMEMLTALDRAAAIVSEVSEEPVAFSY